MANAGPEPALRQLTLPAEGGCRCGSVRVRVTKPPMVTSICHCTGCQRMSGGAFSTTAMIPADGFEVIAGAPVLGGLKGPDSHHRHCPDCFSWVFTTFGPEMPFVNLRAVMLDDTAWFVPFVQTYMSEKLAWVDVRASHSFEAFPPPDQYEPLLADYARLYGSRED